MGTYELEMQRAFAQALKTGDVLYDIGANVGFYTLLGSVCVGSSGRVYSFEPLARNVADLKRHIELNRLSNCQVIEAAVWQNCGTERFDSSRPRSMGWLSKAGTDIVSTVALDALVDSGAARAPNVLKIDVEGAEFGVLKGGSQMIRGSKPIILLATHGQDAREACIRLLQELGYRIESMNGFPVRASDELLGTPRTV